MITDQARMMEEWLALRKQIDEMTAKAETLKSFIESLAMEAKIPGAECIETFKGTYDWERIAMTFNPTEEEIANFSSVAWNKLSEKIAPSRKEIEEIKKKFYSQGSKFWLLRVVREK